VPRLLNSRWALTAAGVVAVGAGLGGAAVMAHEPGQGAISPTTPEQCQAIQAAWTASASHQVGMTADDPVTLREGFMGARDALADAPVPSGVADDWALVTHYLDTVAAAVAEVVPTDGEAITAVVGATLADLNTPEVTAASARITTYLTGGCAG
jgi:triacylglycerol esterase/lipase EstA (alpha/beta hydrolase family)